VKSHGTNSFPSGTPNPPIGLDFGENVRNYAILGKVQTQREFNRLRTLARDTWYQYRQCTLTIGTGASAITATGDVTGLHVEWNAAINKFIVTLNFSQAGVFIA